MCYYYYFILPSLAAEKKCSTSLLIVNRIAGHWLVAYAWEAKGATRSDPRWWVLEVKHTLTHFVLRLSRSSVERKIDSLSPSGVTARYCFTIQSPELDGSRLRPKSPFTQNKSQHFVKLFQLRSELIEPLFKITTELRSLKSELKVPRSVLQLAHYSTAHGATSRTRTSELVIGVTVKR